MWCIVISIFKCSLRSTAIQKPRCKKTRSFLRNTAVHPAQRFGTFMSDSQSDPQSRREDQPWLWMRRPKLPGARTRPCHAPHDATPTTRASRPARGHIRLPGDLGNSGFQDKLKALRLMKNLVKYVILCRIL